MTRHRSVVRNLGLALITTFVVSSPIAAQPGAPVPPPPPDPPAPPAVAPRVPRAPRPPHIPPDVRAQVEADLHRARADIDRALAEIDRNPHIPAHLKSKLKVKLGKLRNADLDDLIEMAGEMDEFGREMQEWGEELQEELQEEIQEEVQRALADGKLKYKLKAKAKGHGPGDDYDYDFDFDFDFDHDDDDDDDHDDYDDDYDPWAGTLPGRPAPAPGRMGRMPHVPSGPVILDLGDDFALDVDIDALQLTTAQRTELKRIQNAERAAVAPAAQRIDQLSRELHSELENDDTTDAEINRLVDEISRQESVVRKARLSSLVKTRKLLTNAQRTKVDGRTR